MDKVNVLIVSRFDLSLNDLNETAALDARVSLSDATALFVSELRRNGKTGLRIDRLESAAKLVRYPETGTLEHDFDALLAEAEVIYASTLVPANIVARAPKLKWIHMANAGIEPFVSAGIAGTGIVATNSRGAHAVAIAEQVMGFALALSRDFPRIIANQHARRWERLFSTELRGKVMGIVGLGAIGTETARLAKGFGMHVVGTRRSAVPGDAEVAAIDLVYPRSELRRMMSQCDFVVVAVPLTSETKGMIGKEELRSMKPAAFLINIARGEIVDQRALIQALQEGWIRGAALDVFDVEPLPPDSQIWSLPNVIVSPHISGYTEGSHRRVVELFCENLRRYLAGCDLLNVVDVSRGY